MTHPYLTDWRESHLNEWRDTDMAERITLEAPEMRPCNQVAAVRTSTNILIGCAYRRPMPDDAGCISGPHRPAHLSRRDTLGDKAVRWACAAGAVAVVGVLVGERLV